MSRWIRNPFIALPFALLILWLSFRLFRMMLGFSWLAVVVFLLFLAFHRPFRNIVRHFVTDLFKGF